MKEVYIRLVTHSESLPILICFFPETTQEDAIFAIELSCRYQ